jgi:two-component system NtrC family sensor kinase
VIALEPDCVAAVVALLDDPGEAALSSAYELGRTALGQGLGILDVMSLQEAVLKELVLSAPHSEQERMARATSSFFREFLSPFEMSFRGYRDANRDLKRLFEELNAAYLELQSKQSQLVQSAKMASLGELVAGVAHEINNPLAFVLSHLGTVNACLNKLEPGVKGEPGGAQPPAGDESLKYWERARTRLREIEGGVERIRDLVLRLRTFSRLDEGAQKRVSIKECVASVLTILDHRLGGRIRVDTHFGFPDMVECFPSLLNQAIMNLVSNAIDAIEGPGTISISTGADADDYVIAVEDSGAGIPEHLRHRVLDPFFTTKAPGQGTGLGLSITYSIVQRHRGSIEIAPGPTVGTIVTIRFPLAVRPSPDPNPDPSGTR